MPGPVRDRHAVPAPPQVKPDLRGGGRRGRPDRSPGQLPRHSGAAPRKDCLMIHHPHASAIAAAVAGRDTIRLAAAVTDTVRLRALFPSGPIEEHGRDAVVARFIMWFADM